MHKKPPAKKDCSAKGCYKHALALSEHCWGHLPDKNEYRTALIKAIDSGQDLSGENLEKVDLSDAHIEKALLSGANLSQANLSGARLFDSKLENADLIGVDLTDSDLSHCDIHNSDLTKATLVNTRLWNTNLTGSNLTEANLSGADLWSAKLYNARLWHTTFAGAKSLAKKNFSRGPGSLSKTVMINESGILSAEEAYRDLKGYFILNGMYNDASWAAFREKAMERKIFLKKGDLNYIPSLVMNLLCGYGEKPYRIIISAFGAICLFAMLYAALGSVRYASSADYVMKWSDYLYYSTITFTTVGYGDFIPKPGTLFRLLAAIEAFMGIYVMGLFIFTLSRKYSGR